MSDKAISPKVRHLSWGHMEIEGIGRGKDFKLYPGGGREWDWRETGTRHDPGIQPEDVVELVENGAEVVVLSQGMQERLKTKPETFAWLEERNIEVHQHETREAVALYNELAASRPVGGLFHSTC